MDRVFLLFVMLFFGQDPPISQKYTDAILAKTILRLFPSFVKPNHITIFRVFLTPMVALLFWREYYVLGGILFFIASFTDALDGALARTRGEVTEWGKLYDPFADKLLICLAVYVLVMKYLNGYVAAVIITIEIIILASAAIRVHRKQVVTANVFGKTKMILQVLGVLLLLVNIIFNIEILLQISHGTFYLAVVFAILSLFSYSI